MAQSNYPPMVMAAPVVAVISPQFCVPGPVDLTIAKKHMSMAEGGSFSVTDVDDNILLEFTGKLFNLHHHHVLLDAAGNPLATIHAKGMSMHKRFKVFRGESMDPNDLLFKAKTSGAFTPVHFKNDVDVFFAANAREDFADFKVKGSWWDKSCGIYLADTRILLAEMNQKFSVGSVVLHKHKFEVTVNPNVDYAFIAALVVILHEIHAQGTRQDIIGIGMGVATHFV